MEELDLPTMDDYPNIHVLIKIGIYLDEDECERIFKEIFPQFESIYKLKVAHTASTKARNEHSTYAGFGINFHYNMFPDNFQKGVCCEKNQYQRLFFQTKGDFEKMFPNGLHQALFYKFPYKSNGVTCIQSIDFILKKCYL